MERRRRTFTTARSQGTRARNASSRYIWTTSRKTLLLDILLDLRKNGGFSDDADFVRNCPPIVANRFMESGEAAVDPRVISDRVKALELQYKDWIFHVSHTLDWRSCPMLVMPIADTDIEDEHFNTHRRCRKFRRDVPEAHSKIRQIFGNTISASRYPREYRLRRLLRPWEELPPITSDNESQSARAGPATCHRPNRASVSARTSRRIQHKGNRRRLTAMELIESDGWYKEATVDRKVDIILSITTDPTFVDAVRLAGCAELREGILLRKLGQQSAAGQPVTGSTAQMLAPMGHYPTTSNINQVTNMQWMSCSAARSCPSYGSAVHRKQYNTDYSGRHASSDLRVVHQNTILEHHV